MRPFHLFFVAVVGTALLVAGCKKDDDDPETVVAPHITSIHPTSGPKGTIVSITGTNFSNDISAISVFLNGKQADIVNASPFEIQFEVPPKAGTGAVSITVNGVAAGGPIFNYEYTVNVSIFSGFSLQPGLINGNASTARFNTPKGMAIDQNDNIYIADELNHCVRRVTPAGDVVTFAGTGIAGYQDGIASVARFNSPTDITFDEHNGYFYVADKGNHCIRKINIAGDVFTVAGIPGVPGYVDAPGLSARLSNPVGVAVESELPHLYVTDAGNHCIRKLDEFGVMTTFAGSTVPGQQDGTGGAAKFSSPADITWDSAGYFYVTDVINHNIRKINLNGSVNTLAGSGIAGYQDGTPALSEFKGPVGVSADENQIIICDFQNNRIRFISNNNVTTLAGDGNASFLDGIGLQAQFNNPGGIIRTSQGDYYIADTGNNAIRKMTIE